MTRLLKYCIIACLLFYLAPLRAQTLTCPSPYFYYGGPGGISGFITGYNPVTQATINTGIPNPPNAGNSLALLPALNGGTFSPTFYTSAGTYYYYDGSTWVSTGHTSGSAGAVNPGGCGSFIFNIAATSPPTVYAYNGSGNGTAVAVLPGSGYAADVVVDCNCNFYVFNASTNPQVMLKYSPAGVLLTTYTLSGLPTVFGGAGFAIIGNTVYYPNSFNWYSGTITATPTISFSLIPSLGALGVGDFASCPFSLSTGTVSATMSQAGIVCPGQTATVIASTTMSPVSYSWSGPGVVGTNTLSAATVSAAGVYTCFIDNQGCPSSQDTFTISVANGPCISVSSTSITCANLGSATVVATSGVGPYSYTWMPTAQTSSAASGLSPGSYTVTVFDAGLNITFTAGTVFTSLIPLTGTLSSSPSITCNGAATGSAGINLSGGSGAQNYLWSNGVVNYTVPNPQNLSAGLWTYTVTDALTGCTINNAFSIAQPPPITFTLSASNFSTCAGSSVTVTGTVSGGTPPSYSYTWAGGSPGASTYAPVQNSAGLYTYSFNAMDSYSCPAMQTITVNVVPNPVLIVASTSICPLQTGSLSVVGANSYSWNGVPGLNAFTDAPLVSTVYTISGMTAGCTSTTTATITVLAPPNPTITQNGPLCQGEAFVMSVSPAAASYTWTGPSGFNSSAQNNTLNPIAMNQAGLYQVTVTAANSCTNSTSANVIVYPTPTLSAAGSIVCTSQTMSLTASSFPGATFLWTGPLSFTSSLQNILVVNPTVNQSGIYTVQATSVNGCTNATSAFVNVVAPPSLTVSLSSNSLCAQALNGSPNTITLTSSGAASYTLSVPGHFNNPYPGGPASPLSLQPPYVPTGASTATLFGSNGVCSVSTTAIFSVIPNPTISVNNFTPAICTGQSFTYTSSGASSYTWSAANPGNTLYTTGNAAVASPSINSVFSVFGGSLGCNSAIQSSTLSVLPLPTLTVQPNAVVCLGSSVTLVASGTGTLYFWSPTTWLNVSNGPVVQANPPSLQNYVVVSSLNSCTSSAMITVSVLPLPTAAISVSIASLCRNEHIVMTGTSNMNGSYAWSGPTGWIGNGQDLDVVAFSTSHSGTYSLTVSDGNNCQATATQNIVVYDLPTGSFSGKLQNCVPFMASPGFSVNAISAPATSMSWQINGQFFSGNNFNYYVNTPGNYVVSGTVTDLNSCVNTFSTLITGWAKPVADFYFSPDKPVEGLDEIQFTNASSNAASFTWYLGSNERISYLQNPHFSFENTGTYPIALIASNAQGCSDTIVKPLVVFPDFSIYVPNAFTPNEDGLNDLFGPVLRGAKSYTMLIMDRWGEKLFQTSDLKAAWDGSYKGQPCKEDVYIWMIEVKSETYSESSITKKLTGEVVLYR